MAKSKRKAAAKKAAEMQKTPQETVEVVAETQETYEEIVSVPDAAEEIEVEVVAETVAQNLGADQVKMRSVVAECWFSGHCLKRHVNFTACFCDRDCTDFPHNLAANSRYSYTQPFKIIGGINLFFKPAAHLNACCTGEK